MVVGLSTCSHQLPEEASLMTIGLSTKLWVYPSTIRNHFVSFLCYPGSLCCPASGSWSSKHCQEQTPFPDMGHAFPDILVCLTLRILQIQVFKCCTCIFNLKLLRIAKAMHLRSSWGRFIRVPFHFYQQSAPIQV